MPRYKNLNRNKVAKHITQKEGKLVEVNIAQTKEIMKIIFTDFSLEGITMLWFQYQNDLDLDE